MARKKPVPKLAKLKKAPTYQELAETISALVEHNVANLHCEPDSWFIRCYTHDFGNFPTLYLKAMSMRELFIKEKIV